MVAVTVKYSTTAAAVVALATSLVLQLLQHKYNVVVAHWLSSSLCLLSDIR
jgi:hypothetical protein